MALSSTTPPKRYFRNKPCFVKTAKGDGSRIRPWRLFLPEGGRNVDENNLAGWRNSCDVRQQRCENKWRALLILLYEP
ncbi:hypothetical protein KCP69_19885 [Salmonella enterica subsp. enterica]|nr:hypothetical protein KCP69_19885 [Salmonella enterica subsp. enterica]